MHVLRQIRRFGESEVVVLHKGVGEGIGRGEGADSLQAQLLHQPILERAMRPLDATLGRRRVGTQDLDVQLVHGATKLGHASALKRTRLVDAEDRAFITVERDRLAIAAQIILGGLHVIEGRLARDEADQLQAAGGVVYVGQHRARRRALLKPAMFAAIGVLIVTVTRDP
jgi:hypothetical protein